MFQYSERLDGVDNERPVSPAGPVQEDGHQRRYVVEIGHDCGALRRTVQISGSGLRIEHVEILALPDGDVYILSVQYTGRLPGEEYLQTLGQVVDRSVVRTDVADDFRIFDGKTNLPVS